MMDTARNLWFASNHQSQPFLLSQSAVQQLGSVLCSGCGCLAVVDRWVGGGGTEPSTGAGHLPAWPQNPPTDGGARSEVALVPRPPAVLFIHPVPKSILSVDHPPPTNGTVLISYPHSPILTY